ncbi:MAG: HAMP domain-containing histidine kinase [Saprospiraceae bacterium]|nr:HAMP domain-containing histidine kinase [Saprospiraceae bacterium]
MEYVAREKERLIELKNRELVDLRNKLQTQDRGFEILSNFKHDFMGELEKLSSGFKLLKNYLTDKASQNQPISLDDSLLRENTDANWMLKEWLPRYEKRIRAITERLNSEVEKMKIEQEEIHLEEMDIEISLNQVIKDYSHTSKFTIEVLESTGLEKIIIPFDRQLMTTVVYNLIDNSAKHGFQDQGMKYKIISKLNIANENNQPYCAIEYMDNGLGFPEGFTFADYVQRGKKAGSSRGSGIGGDRIRRIIEKHNGIFREAKTSEDDLQNKDKEFPIHFEILLPLT